MPLFAPARVFAILTSTRGVPGDFQTSCRYWNPPAAALTQRHGVNLQELMTMVARGESERREFKKSTGQRTEAMRTVCALLNGLGGFVLFGLTPAGKLVGQDVTTETLDDVHHEL